MKGVYSYSFSLEKYENNCPKGYLDMKQFEEIQLIVKATAEDNLTLTMEKYRVIGYKEGGIHI